MMKYRKSMKNFGWVANKKVVIRTALALSVLVTLGACDYWLGERDSAPLPGKRISALSRELALRPDPQAKDVEILLPSPILNEAWPQAGGVPSHAMRHILIAKEISKVWSSSIGAAANETERYTASPVIANGRIFTMDSASVVAAFDVTSGDKLWSLNLTPDEEDDGHIGGGVAYSQGRIFAAAGFGEVVALDAEKGGELWRRRVNAPMRTAPTVLDGRVFVVTVDNKLIALAASNGQELWEHRGITEPTSLLGGASPAAHGGVVIVPYSSGELVALKAETGQVLWSDSLTSVRRFDEISTLSHIRGRPIIDKGLVFAVSHSEQMVAIDLRTGRRVWERQVGGIESPWVAGDYLFVLTNGAELVCIGRKDGKIYWVSALPRFADQKDQDEPITWTGPILAGDRLIIAGSHGKAMTISPYSGEILNIRKMPGAVTVAPVASDGTVYFLSDNSELTAYR